MKQTTLRTTLLAATLAAATSVATDTPAHDGYGVGWGMAPGMMGGHGAAGGYGMGPGMMGPGMMHGGMMGHGIGYLLSQLNLSPEQWKQLSAVHEDVAKNQWQLMGKMREEAFKLRTLMAAENRDRDAITSQFKKVQDIRLEMFRARLDAHDRLSGVLTAEQKAQLRRVAPWWAHEIE